MFESMMATLFPSCRPRSVEAKETDVAVCVRGQEECAPSPAVDTDRCETPSTDNQSESEQSASEVGRRMRGLGELSKRYACAAARVEQCNLFPCDREMGASGAFDTFDVVVGACRLAEAALIADVDLNQFWARVSATACFILAMKQAKAYSVERLALFVSNRGNATTCIYFCVFYECDTCSAAEMDMGLLFRRVEHAQGQILARLSSHMFRLLVLTPAMCLEVLMDELVDNRDPGKKRVVCAIRSAAARFSIVAHTERSSNMELVRRAHLDDTKNAVAAALLLICVESLSMVCKDELIPAVLINHCLGLPAVAVELALRILDSAMGSDSLVPKLRTVNRHEHCVVKMLSRSTLGTVRASLRNILKKL